MFDWNLKYVYRAKTILINNCLMAYNYFVFQHLCCLESEQDKLGNLIILLPCSGHY